MIVGFDINSIDANKGSETAGDIKVNYSPKILEVEKASVGAIDEDVARIEFKFSVDYLAEDDKVGDIVMKGNVVWKGNVDALVEKWDKDEKIASSVHAPLMNEMYKKLLSEAVGIANTLNLLPPIPTPQVDQ